MCVIFTKHFYFLISMVMVILSCSKNTVNSQFNFLNNNNNIVQSGVCPPYQTNASSTTAKDSFGDCKESVRLGLLYNHPDQNKRTPEILETYDYPYEIHNVTTEDNYILTLYRIIGSPNIGPEMWARRKYPVYLAHGGFMASDGWNFQPGTRNLPFKLADAGFEVWLGNTRGTKYSMGHTIYDAERDLEYWDYSFHELGLYDTPAVINKALNESGAEKVLYVGHSMGTVQIFVSLSELDEMNDKVEAAFLFAPAAILGHANHLMRTLAPFLSSYSVYKMLNPFLRGRVGLPYDLLESLNISIGSFCTPSALECGLCKTLIFQTNGYNAPQINTTEIPNIISKSINTISAKLLSNAMQEMLACKFQQYDYGYRKNMKKYGSPQPPEYKLENIRSSMYLYYGESDRLVTPLDAMRTASSLAPGVLKDLHKVDDELWNHNDFIYAKDADKLLYNRVASEMERLSEI